MQTERFVHIELCFVAVIMAVTGLIFAAAVALTVIGAVLGLYTLLYVGVGCTVVMAILCTVGLVAVNAPNSVRDWWAFHAVKRGPDLAAPCHPQSTQP